MGGDINKYWVDDTVKCGDIIVIYIVVILISDIFSERLGKN